jgi:hypothetical protein
MSRGGLPRPDVSYPTIRWTFRAAPCSIDVYWFLQPRLQRGPARAPCRALCHDEPDTRRTSLILAARSRSATSAATSCPRRGVPDRRVWIPTTS